MGGNELRRVLVEHPLRVSVDEASDDAANWVGRRGSHAASPKRLRAAPDAVEVMRPEQDRPAGRDALEICGGRPATPPAGIPTATPEPVAVAERRCRARDGCKPVVERCGTLQPQLG